MALKSYFKAATVLVGMLAAAVLATLVLAVPAWAASNVLVTDVSPDGSATSVAADSNITTQFNKAMRASTIKGSTFYLKKQGSSTTIPANVSYSGTSKTATLNPDSDLEAGATYTATVKGGKHGVRASDGGRLGGTNDSTATFANGKVTWSFTVVNIPTAPTGVTATPNPLSFTSDALCFPEQKWLTVTNNGPGDVSFADVSITGPDAARFSTGSQQFLTNNGPFTVLAGNFFQDQVTFVPSGGPPQPRTYSATLTYKDGTGATIGSPVTLSAKTTCLVFG